MKDVAWLVIFLYFCLYFSPWTRQMYGKVEKINKHSIFWLVKLHPPNLVFNNAIHKLCKIQFWKKLFAIGFPSKHCNLTALPTLQVGVENRDKPYSISHRELCGGDSTRPHLSGHGYWRQYYQTTLRQLLSSVSWNEVVPPGLVSLFSYSIVSAWKWLKQWMGLDHLIVRITFF